MNPNNGYYQDYNVGSPQPMTSKQLKYLTIPEVVSRSFLFMFAALLITAFAAFTTSLSTAITLLSGGTFYVLLLTELADFCFGVRS